MKKSAGSAQRRSINFWVLALAGSLTKGAMRYYSTKFGIRLPEMRVLNTLADDGDLAARDLVALTAMDKGLMSRVLAGLSENGMIVQAGDEERVRMRKWSLTPAGREMVDRLSPEWNKRWSVIQADLSQEQRDQLKDMLQTLFFASEELGRREQKELQQHAEKSGK